MRLLTPTIERVRERGPRAWPLWACVALLFVLLAVCWPMPTSALDRDSRVPDSVADLGTLERAFQETIARVSPSVVGIRARRRTLTAVPRDDEALGSVERMVVLNGSGTILRANGLILTNEHVIQSTTEIDVVLHDGRTLPATVVAADARSDLAVLRIDAEGLTPATFCNWQTVARGQWTVAIGNPYGLGSDGHLSVSVGVIANLGRRLPGLGEADDRLYADMIQTTAAIHPGNSGGPLFNLHGELTGVVTAVHARSVDDEGVGFAIAMTPAKRRVIDQLLAGRQVEHGYLGLTVGPLERAEREEAGLDSGGLLVEQVEPSGPAAKADVRVGDIITHCDGQRVGTPVRLAELVGQTPIGSEAELRLRREQKSLTVRATVDVRQVNRVSWMRNAVLWRGMRLADSTAEARQRMNVAAGVAGVVVIDVRDGSPADRARVRIGDVIESVEDTAVREVWEFLKAAHGQKGEVRLLLHSRGVVAVSP